MPERKFRVLTGLVAILFFVSATVTGVKIATGAIDPTYQLQGEFAAAGQGLISGSDVKIHGVNIGRVAKIRLRDGKAQIRVDINKGQKVPVDARAVVRPKTLFGEKFIDIEPGDHEASGPFLEDEGVIKDTLGGFELERVLSELFPILKAVRPSELTVIVDTLAGGAEGVGGAINRTIGNFGAVADVQARHAADTQQFLDDLADLSDELAARSEDLVAAGRDLNQVLPVLNASPEELATFLDQTARLSGDLADVLEANRPFMETAVVQGGKSLQVLYDQRAQLQPLITGLRQFFQVLGSAGGFDWDVDSDGTKLAGVKLIFGGGCPSGRLPPPCPAVTPPASAEARSSTAVAAPEAGPATPPTLPRPTRGTEAVLELIGGLLG